MFSLASKGVSAACICGSNENEFDKDDLVNGNYQIIFFTPESLILNRPWRRMLSSQIYEEKLRALVVDEEMVSYTVFSFNKHYFFIIFTFRGETFRPVLLRVGEFRSLLSPTVHLLALTATATPKLRKKVVSLLGMQDPIFTYISPCRPNIVNSVETFDTIPNPFGPLLETIKMEKFYLPWVLIYCRKYQDCSSLYSFFKKGLGVAFTEPSDAPDIADFRIVDMFTSCTDEATKSKIMERFTKPSYLRIVIATVTFGMGIDCPDVHQIIHLGPPDDLESYIQETGCAGRNGKTSYVNLLKTKGCNRFTDEYMLAYLENTERCRRQMLFSEMEGYHSSCESIQRLCLCCDICKKKCVCNSCILYSDQGSHNTDFN